MTEQHQSAPNFWDFLAGQKPNANMPNLKTVVGKLSTLPGMSQFKGLQIQMLRVQEELLKGQLVIIEQIIQAIEAAPEGCAGAANDAAPETPANGKIAVS